MRRVLLSISVILLVNQFVFSQTNLSTRSKRAIKAYQEANHAYSLMSYQQAIYLLKEAIQDDPEFIEAYLILAEVYMDSHQDNLAIDAYMKGLPINPERYTTGYINLAKLQFSGGEYDGAKKSYEQYLQLKDTKDKYINQAHDGITRCNFAIWLVNHPVPFHPVNLGHNVNTRADEYWPSLSADEQTLVITRKVPGDPAFGGIQEDFFISQAVDSTWGQMKNAGYPLNTQGNEGAQSISANGRLMVFTACNRSDGYGRCDLYYSEKSGNKWSLPKNLGTPVNTASKETQPSLSADGRVLYFASDRPGGKGDLDLWVTRKKEDGNWSVPENLGDTINTPGEEMAPFIHQDNQTLYFASNYHLGLGGFDIFISRRDSAGRWGKPENLGYPINTWRDEFGLIVNAEGNTAYYASDMNPEDGKDIYMFPLPENLRPEVVSYMKGKVMDAETHAYLKAKIELIDLESGNMINELTSDGVNGEFLVCIPPDKDYLLNVSCEGYLFYSEHFALKGVHEETKPYLKNIELKPIKVGESIVLNNIFFDTDSYKLKKESKIELDKVIRFLTDNPSVKIKISGHTDNIGSSEYNLQLSKERAKEVVDYLIENSIVPGRLEYVGFGYSKPVADNATEQGRAMNRRTELEVIEK